MNQITNQVVPNTRGIVIEVTEGYPFQNLGHVFLGKVRSFQFHELLTLLEQLLHLQITGKVRPAASISILHSFAYPLAFSLQHDRCVEAGMKPVKASHEVFLGNERTREIDLHFLVLPIQQRTTGTVLNPESDVGR